jgi:hypothetical protein
MFQFNRTSSLCQVALASLLLLHFFLSTTGKSCAFITCAHTMRTGSNLPNAESSRFSSVQQIGTPISENCAVHLNYWQQSRSSPSFLLNSPCLNGGGPSAGCNQSSCWVENAAGVPLVRSLLRRLPGSSLTFRPSNERVSTD